MSKIIDLLQFARGKDAYKNLAQVLKKEREKEAILGIDDLSIPTGPKTTHQMMHGEEDPLTGLFKSEWVRSKRAGESPFGGWLREKDGPVLAFLDEKLKAVPVGGMQIPTSLDRALAKVRNKPNVFFADGTEI